MFLKDQKFIYKFVLLILIQICFLELQIVHAACLASGVNPAAEMGALNLDTSVSQYKFCDGTNWQILGGSSSYPLYASNGSVSAPAYSFSNFTATGFYATNTASLAFAVSGTQRLLINSLGHSIFGSSTAPAGVLRIANGVLSFGNNIQESSDPYSGTYYLYSPMNLRFWTSNNQSIQITPPLNLGISMSLNLPPSSGTSGQFLQGDGAGNLTWVDILGFKFSVVSQNSSFSIASTDNYNFYTTTGSSPITVSLPSASLAGVGFVTVIKRMGSGSVTLSPNGGDQIDNATSYSLNATGDSLTLVSTGSGWVIYSGAGDRSLGGCIPGRVDYTSPGTYSIPISTSQAASCTYTVRISGAGGSSAKSGATCLPLGGAGGALQFNFAAATSGTLSVLVGQVGSIAFNSGRPFGGGTGKGNTSGSNYGGGGGGASAVVFNTTLLAVVGGGGGGACRSTTGIYVGGAGGAGTSTTNAGAAGTGSTTAFRGSGGNGTGGSGGTGTINGGAGGTSSGIGSTNAGVNSTGLGGLNYSNFAISGGGGACYSSTSTFGGGGGGGYGGGGGGACTASTNSGSGGGGGGYTNTGALTAISTIAGAASDNNGWVTISWQ